MTDARLRKVLWLSAGLNVGLVVAIAVVILVGWGAPDPRLPGKRPSPEQAARAVWRFMEPLNLDAEQAETIRRSIDTAFQRLDSRFETEKRDRLELLVECVKAPDSGKANEELACRGQEGHQQFSQIVHGALREIARELTPEQRGQLEQELRKALQ